MDKKAINMAACGISARAESARGAFQLLLDRCQVASEVNHALNALQPALEDLERQADALERLTLEVPDHE